MLKEKTWIELFQTALKSNVLRLQKLAGNKKLLAVVKANAYGHGIKEVSTLLSKYGVDWYGVDNIDEALKLRENLDTRVNILVLGYIPLSRLNDAVANNISFIAYNMETMTCLSRLKPGKKARVHIKIETGMNRQGVMPNDLDLFIDSIKSTKNIFIEGVSTHFAEPIDKGFTEKQIKSFKNSIGELEKKGAIPKFIHSQASEGLLYASDAPGNLVRVGKALYGFFGDFEPVLTWKAVIAQVKKIEKGESVGYGHTWTAKKKTKIAVVPVGYSDGFDRRLSNKGRVLVKGKYVNVVGRVAMNMFMVDVTGMDVKVEDEVVIIGEQMGKTITPADFAEAVGTIDHEVFSRLSQNIAKVII